jgi:transglutaminase-like putative cysteine protease
MIELLSWLIRKLGARAILSLALLLIALGNIALALRSIVRGLDTELVLTVTVLGVLVGWVLAKSPLPGWLAGIVALTLGAEAIIVRVGQLGGKVIALARALIDLSAGILAWWFSHQVPDARPTLLILAELWNGASALLLRLGDWVVVVSGGVPAFDPVAAALLWSGVLWMVAAWAAWGVRRRAQAFESVIPGIALAATMLAYTGGDTHFLVLPLGALLLLMALIGHGARERRWTLAGIGTAEDLHIDLMVTAVPLSVILVIVAVTAPSLSIRQIVRFAQDRMREPIGDANRLPDSLGLIPQAAQESVFDTVRAPGLPRRHLIGAGQELSKQMVMAIKTDDVSETRYYWRSSTYDRYNGRGWFTGDTEIVEYEAGEPIAVRLAFQRRVIQEVQPLGNLSGLLYATGILVTADHDFRVAWRSPEDAFSVNMHDEGTTYRAESLVPALGENQLRAAGSNYPEWVRARYLHLPDDVPVRVLILARDLTATAPTPYDRARVIEGYLRAFPYTLDLPPPPPNRDTVDYFLFDLKRGYCDYYATAMVVLARAAGLPARLVVGYAPGTYDATAARYIVTEADAHSWVEVYFPGYGWVEFEPTTSRAPVELPTEAPQIETPAPESGLSATIAARQDRFVWLLAIPGVLALLGSGIAIGLRADDWRLHRLSPESAIDSVYRRLCSYTRRLGLAAHASHTPNEVAALFTERFSALARKERARATLSLANREVCDLTDLYVQSCYSPRAPDVAARQQAIRTWQRLRQRLWFAWAMVVMVRLTHRETDWQSRNHQDKRALVPT